MEERSLADTASCSCWPLGLAWDRRFGAPLGEERRRWLIAPALPPPFTRPERRGQCQHANRAASRRTIVAVAVDADEGQTVKAGCTLALPMRRRGRLWRTRSQKVLGLLDSFGQAKCQASQRVAVARALANRPETILADEPVRRASANLSAMLQGLAQLESRTIIMVTNEPPRPPTAEYSHWPAP